MLRYLIVELVLPLILFLFVRSILKSLFQGGRDAARKHEQRVEHPPVVAGGELKKDPVCGTYVSTSLGVTRKVHGEQVYFCSPECRDKFVG